jgi:hypothetical protein
MVVTKNVVVVSWIDGSPISLSPTGVNPDLLSSLSSSISCHVLLGFWAIRSDVYLNTSTDRDYANSFLLKNSANAAPPATMSLAVLTGEDFRMFNPLQATYRKTSPITGLRVMTLPPKIGKTPDPCPSPKVPSLAAETHPDNGFSKIVSGTGGDGVVQLAESRIGSIGQTVHLTINTSIVSTPWIWTVLRVDSGTPQLADHSMVPTHTLYIDGSRISPPTTQDIPTFLTKDDSYQMPAASIP